MSEHARPERCWLRVTGPLNFKDVGDENCFLFLGRRFDGVSSMDDDEETSRRGWREKAEKGVGA